MFWSTKPDDDWPKKCPNHNYRSFKIRQLNLISDINSVWMTHLLLVLFFSSKKNTKIWLNHRSLWRHFIIVLHRTIGGKRWFKKKRKMIGHQFRTELRHHLSVRFKQKWRKIEIQLHWRLFQPFGFSRNCSSSFQWRWTIELIDWQRKLFISSLNKLCEQTVEIKQKLTAPLVCFHRHQWVTVSVIIAMLAKKIAFTSCSSFTMRLIESNFSTEVRRLICFSFLFECFFKQSFAQWFPN